MKLIGTSRKTIEGPRVSKSWSKAVFKAFNPSSVIFCWTFGFVGSYLIYIDILRKKSGKKKKNYFQFSFVFVSGAFFEIVSVLLNESEKSQIVNEANEGLNGN